MSSCRASVHGRQPGECRATWRGLKSGSSPGADLLFPASCDCGNRAGGNTRENCSGSGHSSQPRGAFEGHERSAGFPLNDSASAAPRPPLRLARRMGGRVKTRRLARGPAPSVFHQGSCASGLKKPRVPRDRILACFAITLPRWQFAENVTRPSGGPPCAGRERADESIRGRHLFEGMGLRRRVGAFGVRRRRG